MIVSAELALEFPEGEGEGEDSSEDGDGFEGGLDDSGCSGLVLSRHSWGVGYNAWVVVSKGECVYRFGCLMGYPGIRFEGFVALYCVLCLRIDVVMAFVLVKKSPGSV